MKTPGKVMCVYSGERFVNASGWHLGTQFTLHRVKFSIGALLLSGRKKITIRSVRGEGQVFIVWKTVV